MEFLNVTLAVLGEDDVISDPDVGRVVTLRRRRDGGGTGNPVRGVESYQQAVRVAMERIRERIQPGGQVAITVGSRGIRDLAQIVRLIGAEVRKAGGEPFAVPAMGSHGGGTAEGQVRVLKELGIEESSIRMPIRATMETAYVGKAMGGKNVVCDALAWESDGIIAVNRIKPHTDFHANVESGLSKILAVGLGKRRGARELHSTGPSDLANSIVAAVEVLVATGKVIGGIGLVEDAWGDLVLIRGLDPGQIGGLEEREMLEMARRSMGRLPVEVLDVLVVDVLGKDKSGSGVDPNVIGRMRIYGQEEPDAPWIPVVVGLGLSEASEGNAVGVGLCDFITKDLLSQIDFAKMYINGYTSGLGGLQRCALPMVCSDPRVAVSAAIEASGASRREGGVRICRVKSSLELDEVRVSENVLRDIDYDVWSIVEERDALRGVGGLLGDWR